MAQGIEVRVLQLKTHAVWFLARRIVHHSVWMVMLMASVQQRQALSSAVLTAERGVGA